MSTFSDEVFDAICERIAAGGEDSSLRRITMEDGMPHERTVYRWLEVEGEEGERRRQKYARARERQGDREFDECREIADAATPEDYQVARLRIDTRKWRAGKLRPKVYGDKLDVEHRGGVQVTLESDADKL